MSEHRQERPSGAVTAPGDSPAAEAPAGRFRDRGEAGRRLAALLERYRAEEPLVFGIPRGGVPVAAEVARALAAPLDVVVVRKLGAPQNPEYAIGALAEGGVHVLSERTVRALRLSREGLEALIARAQRELDRRVRRYRGERAPLEVAGRTAIVVDDGLATGRSALAAILSLRRRGAARVILAAPVGAPQSVASLREHADDVVCVETPAEMWAVGLWYADFRPTTDEEVAALLAGAEPERPARAESERPAGAEPERPAGAEPERPAGAEPAAQHEAAAIPVEGGVTLAGELTLPAGALGVVAFAHGSGSSRSSARNRAVAAELLRAGYATLLFDLLSEQEEGDRRNVFDVPLLASRLMAASAWLRARPQLPGLALAYFGASTGAAAALTAAARLGDAVGAVISRGGRPDLALELAAVRAPTLLIVGGADREVLELNRLAQRELRAPSELAVVQGATHLFEEPGALQQVSRLAIAWLDRHLRSSSR